VLLPTFFFPHFFFDCVQEKDCAYLRATHLMPFSSQRTPLDEVVPFCNNSEVLKAKCGVECDNLALMELLQPIAGNSASTSQFIWFLLLTLIAWSSMENVASLGDTICFGVLGTFYSELPLISLCSHYLG